MEWRPEETTPTTPDANVIRIGPPNGDGNELCFVQLDQHSFRVGDEFQRFVCPRTFAQDGACPACDEQWNLFRSSKESGNKAEQDRANEMRARTVAVFAILDKRNLVTDDGAGRKRPNWQLMVIGHGMAGAGRQTTFAKLSGKFEREGDLSHPTQGKWIRVVYHKGIAPGTTVKSARFADWDFEPLHPPGPIGPKGWERGLPDLRLLLDESTVPSAEQITSMMTSTPEPWDQPAVGATPPVEAGLWTEATTHGTPDAGGDPEPFDFGPVAPQPPGPGVGDEAFWEDVPPSAPPAARQAAPSAGASRARGRGATTRRSPAG